MSLFETRQIYKVIEVTRMVKGLLEDSPISELWIEGEVSNFKYHTSGHIYFTLKDSHSQIRCAIFKPVASHLKFIPENGDSIIMYGRLTVYEVKGEYQIVGSRVEPLGIGALQQAFEKLKKKLEAEGLFDPAHKKPIPLISHRIGVITSSTGAAIRDIINIITRRFNNASILIHPVAVQGEGAAQEIAAAIKTMNEIEDIGVLIIGRGGGSIEDLWAFNEEIVVKSIYESRIPVISAVGHETDFTLADFVADYRAPTPSAAAEKAAPNKADLVNKLYSLNTRLRSQLRSRMELLKQRVKTAESRLQSKSGRDQIEQLRQKLDDLLSRGYDSLQSFISQNRINLDNYQEKLKLIGIPSKISEIHKDILNLEQRGIMGIKHLLNSKKDNFGTLIAKLNALSPLSVLQRGYSISLKHPSGEVIKDANDVSVGDKIKTRLAKGEIISEVEKTGT
ncbi:exodeoxyribonuclease VII large subunit [Candidatus Poribacteria bacterium]|nr:exodeoxyribonuclease VII large subunit [Candidatus Poribacteria bacterium]